ncbi:hypothetical protein L0F63_004453 [Massospora cicadina]|nr:hypothetical protein L0F63_004453 [Massospora cicadina]
MIAPRGAVPPELTPFCPTADGRPDIRNSAVLRFATVQRARDFICSNPRGLLVQNYHVGLFFGSGHEDGFWSCVECGVVNHETRSYCLQCGILDRSGEADARVEIGVNVGEADIGFAPSHMILVRGLDTLTTEEELFDAVRSIAEVGRVWLVKDRFSRVSCGFGFLEFPDQAVAGSFIAKLSAAQNGYVGLGIGGKWVTPCYSHPHSLVPAPEPSEWTVWGTDGAPYQYWDVNLGLSEFPHPTPRVPPLDLSAALEAFDAFVADAPLPAPPALSALDLPGTVSAAPVSFQYSADPIPRASPKLETPSRPASPLPDTQVRSIHDADAPPEGKAQHPEPTTADRPESEQEPKPQPAIDEALLDYTRLICRLCQRQFREAKDLDKHKELSQLHKSNLGDEAKVQKALQAVQKEATQYQDRAEEGKLQAPAPQKARGGAKTKKPPSENIGSRLLSKMGWKEGQGLGKDGRGIREPIKGERYAKGAGLGSGAPFPPGQGVANEVLVPVSL